MTHVYPGSLCSPATVYELVAMIVNPPPEDADAPEAHYKCVAPASAWHEDNTDACVACLPRCQYMATEVICLGSAPLMAALVAQTPRPSHTDTWPHLRKLFSVFERPAPLQAYILGYLNKVHQHPIPSRDSYAHRAPLRSWRKCVFPSLCR